jgi:hypothetical protein
VAWGLEWVEWAVAEWVVPVGVAAQAVVRVEVAAAVARVVVGGEAQVVVRVVVAVVVAAANNTNRAFLSD